MQIVGNWNWLIEQVVAQGWLEPHGEKRGRYYTARQNVIDPSSELIDRSRRIRSMRKGVNNSPTHVQHRGPELPQQAQMILQYVQAHRRITRREVAKLCQVSPHQAYRLLSRLVNKGYLLRRGSKKGTWYEMHI